MSIDQFHSPNSTRPVEGHATLLAAESLLRTTAAAWREWTVAPWAHLPGGLAVNAQWFEIFLAEVICVFEVSGFGDLVNFPCGVDVIGLRGLRDGLVPG